MTNSRSDATQASESEMWNVLVQYYVLEHEWDYLTAATKANQMRRQGLLRKTYNLVQGT